MQTTEIVLSENTAKQRHSSVSESRHIAEEHFTRAKELYSVERLPDAIDEMQRAVNADCQFKRAVDVLAFWREELESTRCSEHRLRQEVLRSPDDMESLSELARVLTILGNQDEARSVYEEIVKNDHGSHGKRAKKMLGRLSKNSAVLSLVNMGD